METKGESIIVTCDGYEIWTKEFGKEEGAANALRERYWTAAKNSDKGYSAAFSFSEEPKDPAFCRAVYFKDGEIRDCIAIGKQRLFKKGPAALFSYDDESGLKFKNCETVNKAAEEMKSEYEANVGNAEGDVYFASRDDFSAFAYSEDFSYACRIVC